MDEPSQDDSDFLGEAVAGPRVDRDLMFARVEQRLLGRALTPVRVGRFVVLERIGHGGMGVVYAAHDPQLERKVAVKLVDDADGDGTPRAHQELLREARAAAALTHPNVVTVYEVGIEGDAVFLAMEFVDGPTLRGWLSQRSPRGWREVVTMFLAAAEGLAAAHAAGLIHRDFKPDNVLIGEDGRPRVADFGLARPTPRARTDREYGDEDASIPGGESSTSIAGTPRYMAPEQHEGRGIGPASDQFALCVALYEALFERHPFEADGLAALVRRVMAGQPDHPGAVARGVPASVVRLVMKGLAAEPDQRHPSLDVLCAGLRRVLRRRRRILLGGGAIALAGTMGALGYGAAPQPAPDPCAEATAPMDVAWGPSQAGELRAAFSATERSGSGGIAQLVTHKLDRYAEQWSEIRTRSCEAAHRQGQRSELLMELSYACLDRRLHGMSVLLDAFEHADARVVDRAAQAVDELAPLSVCEDRRALLSGSGSRLESRSDRTQPGAYDRWLELFDRYHEAEALRSLGRLDEAQVIADALVEEGRARGLRGVEAIALELRGRIGLQRSELPAAEADLRRAIVLALEADVAGSAVESLLGLSRLRRERRESVEQARVLLDVARGLVQRGALPTELALRVAVEEARVERLLRNFARARDVLVDALVEASSLGEDHSIVISARSDLAGNLVSLGQLREAQAIFEELLPRRIAARGPQHRSVGTLLINLGVTAQNLQQWDDAAAHYERALDLYRASGNRRRAEQVQFRVGVMRREQGQLDDAIAVFERLLEERTERLGAEHADLAEVLESLAEAERQKGRHDDALRHAVRSLELLKRAHGPEYLDLRASLTSIGKIQIDRGNFVEAEAALRRAERLVTSTEVDELVRGEIRFDLARAIVHDPQKRDEALGKARQALASFEEAGERASSWRGDVQAWLAEHGG